jgi:hypothetical protein
MFEKPVGIQKGEVVERDGFGYADLLPAGDFSVAQAFTPG